MALVWASAQPVVPDRTGRTAWSLRASRLTVRLSTPALGAQDKQHLQTPASGILVMAGGGSDFRPDFYNEGKVQLIQSVEVV